MPAFNRTKSRSRGSPSFFSAAFNHFRRWSAVAAITNYGDDTYFDQYAEAALGSGITFSTNPTASVRPMALTNGYSPIWPRRFSWDQLCRTLSSTARSFRSCPSLPSVAYCILGSELRPCEPPVMRFQRGRYRSVSSESPDFISICPLPNSGT